MFITLALLKSFPDQLEQLFGAVPRIYRNWAPESWDGIPSETFTAIEQICHIRDIEIDGYQARFRRLLEEENPALPSIDSYALANIRRYAEADPAEILITFRSARDQTISLIGSLSDQQLQRSGSFEGYGPVTVQGLVHYLCSHDQQHLAGIQWLLGKIESRAAV
jgi:hypothetical protein